MSFYLIQVCHSDALQDQDGEQSMKMMCFLLHSQQIWKESDRVQHH